MESKTIKISKENYSRLLKIAADLQKERGELVTFDDTLNEMELKNGETGKKGDIMKLAGSWKMSDEEAENFLNRIYKERKVSSRRLNHGVS
jgi:predicted CopG family antitoxin